MGSLLFGIVQQAPELSFPRGGEEGFHKRYELLRELGALEGGPLPELEKSVSERRHLLAQANQLLDKLVSDLGATRLELERRDGAVASSQSGLNILQERIVEVSGLHVSCCGKSVQESRSGGESAPGKSCKNNSSVSPALHTVGVSSLFEGLSAQAHSSVFSGGVTCCREHVSHATALALPTLEALRSL